MPKSRSKSAVNSACPPANESPAAVPLPPLLHAFGSAVAPSPFLDDFSSAASIASTSRTEFGGIYSRVPVCFSADQKVYFLCSGAAIKMFNTNSGELLGELLGHTGPVTSLATSPSNRFVVWSGSLDGSIRCWSIVDQTLLFTVAGLGCVLHFLLFGSDIVYANVNSNFPHDLRACKIISIDIKMYQKNISDGKPASNDESAAAASASSGVEILYKSRHCVGVAVNPRRTHLASISKRQLTIFDLRSGDRVKHSTAASLTSLAFHPHDDYLVCGDESGKLHLWHNYSDQKSPIVSKLHWHSGAVNSVQFTSDGVYLLSGGLEAVLVLWQLETGHKQFIPRFQSAIQSISISPEGDLYAISCTDNIVNFVSAVSSKITRSFFGIQYAAQNSSFDSLSSDSQPAPQLILDPRTNSFIFPSHRSTFLQFFDIASDKQLMELNVTQRQLTQVGIKSMHSINENFIGGSSTTRISAFAVSRNGELLATVEKRHDGQFKDKERLKVWIFNRQLQVFQLNTNILSPHSASIHTILFHPTLPQFLSLSHDNSFKVWQQIHKFFIPSANKQSQSAADKLYFICKFQLKFREFQCHSAAFNADGSQLAVSFGQVITIWNSSEDYLMNSVISQPNPTEPIRKLVWLNDRIISISPNFLFVWNPAIDHQAAIWQMKINCSTLISDQQSRFAVVFTRTRAKIDESKKRSDSSLFHRFDRFIAVFSPDSPIPINLFNVSDLRLERFGDSASHFSSELAFKAAEQQNQTPNSLVYWNKQKQLIQVEIEPKVKNNKNKQINGPISVQPEELSLFDKLYGSKLFRASQLAAAVEQRGESNSTPVHAVTFLGEFAAEYRKLFSGPTHILPPPAALFELLIDSIMKKRTATFESEENKANQFNEKEEKKNNETPSSPSFSSASATAAAVRFSTARSHESLEKQLLENLNSKTGNSRFQLDFQLFNPVADSIRDKISLKQSKKRIQMETEETNGIEENGISSKKSRVTTAASAASAVANGKSKKSKK